MSKTTCREAFFDHKTGKIRRFGHLFYGDRGGWAQHVPLALCLVVFKSSEIGLYLHRFLSFSFLLDLVFRLYRTHAVAWATYPTRIGAVAGYSGSQKYQNMGSKSPRRGSARGSFLPLF